jgi:hypothetical protein
MRSVAGTIERKQARVLDDGGDRGPAGRAGDPVV